MPRGSCQLVATTADPALDVALAGLLPGRGRSEMTPTSRDRGRHSGLSIVARGAMGGQLDPAHVRHRKQG